MCANVCICVCVRQREREREKRKGRREKVRERQRDSKRDLLMIDIVEIFPFNSFYLNTDRSSRMTSTSH